MALKTTRWKRYYIRCVALYLGAAFKGGDPALIAHLLGVAARAKGMAGLAR